MEASLHGLGEIREGWWDSPNLEVIPVTSEPEGRGFESHPRNIRK